MHSLNHIFRVIWNESAQRWQAVSEVARGRCKSSSSRLAKAASLSGLSALLGLLAPPQILAQTNMAPGTLPIGGKVVGGQASIVYAPSAPSLTVQQSSPRAVLNWDSFNLGSKAQIRFDQPSSQSVTLNRVLGGGAQQHFGATVSPRPGVHQQP